jgi:UDP-glucose 4-epimerase
MAEFHLLQPSQRDRIVEVVTSFNPHVLINLSVWEPDARAGLAHARQFTADATTAIVGAAAECPALESMVLRSGVEVYGRSHGTPTRPTEECPLDPTTEYGRMLANIERSARDVGRRVGIAVGKLRLAPVLGKHVPSPLGRLLRQPVVPFSLLADSPFAVIEDGDAARAFVAAAARRLDEPLNIVAPGAITTVQAIVRGRKVPLPIVGPEWAVARQLSRFAGAPIPEHVVELMHRGRLADGARAAEVLGFSPQLSTPEVIDHLYAWENVVRIGRIREVA